MKNLASLGIIHIASVGITLCRQRTKKALIRLHRCADWFVPSLFTYGKNTFCHDVAKMSHVMRKPIYAIYEQQRPDQLVHPRSLICAFVVCCLDSNTPLAAISEISSLYLASVVDQVGLSLTWLKNSEDRFSCDKAKIILSYFVHVWEVSFMSLSIIFQ